MSSETNYIFQPVCYINNAPCMKLLGYTEIAAEAEKHAENETSEEE